MMPAHNAGLYITEAIESIRNQTYMNWELCIVDDGSVDDTYDIAKDYMLKDSRIRVDQIPHSGCPVARNRCLEMMSGDIYARQDADDITTKDRLEIQVQYLLDYDHSDIVTCRLAWLREGKIIPRTKSPMIPDFYVKGKGGSPVCASIVAWKYVYDRVGGFDVSMLAGSDGDWNFRALEAKMLFSYIDRPMYIQRRHASQLSQALRNNQRQNHERARKRYGQ